MHNLTPTDMDPPVERRRDERGEEGLREMDEEERERERETLLFCLHFILLNLFIFLSVEFQKNRSSFADCVAFVCL